MDEAPRGPRNTDRQARWVATWREAVRSSHLAVGLVELSSTRFIQLSDRAAGLLRTRPEQATGVEYLSVTERPSQAAQTFQMVRDGLLDGIRGRRRFHRPDGSKVELQLTGWAIRSRSGPDLGLWVADELSAADRAAAPGDLVALAPWREAGSDVYGAEIALDDRWRIAHLSSGADLVLGRPSSELLAMSIFDLASPDDANALLLAFARATTDTTAEVRIRVRDPHGSWRAVRAVLTVLEGDGTLPFAIRAAPAVEPEWPHPTAGATQIAGYLRRIAAQIEAAGIASPWMERADVFALPVMKELSARQAEIAARLIRGERVATIAAELFLSQSTVRNHLSAIFQKFGVHSQPEFLALWRGSPHRDPSVS